MTAATVCMWISLTANAVQLTFIVLTVKELKEAKRLSSGFPSTSKEQQ